MFNLHKTPAGVIISLASVLCISAFPQDDDELTYTIVSSFPTPGPDPQGLAWDESYLWLADDSMNTIYKIDPTDGSVVLSFASPGTKPKGLTYDGANLWCADDDSLKIFKLDPENGAIITYFNAYLFPNKPDELFPAQGLAWDGEFLYACFEAGWSSQIVKIDTANGSPIQYTYTRGTSNGLALDATYIWNSIDNDGTILGLVDQYDVNGQRLDTFVTPGYYPMGSTFDGTCFWLFDSGSDSLYQIQLLTAGVEDNQQNIPHKAVLFQNFPNPFNPTTTIRFDLPEVSYISLVIYDILGREVRTILDNREEAGFKSMVWDGKDNNGNIASAGIYIYALKAWSQESEKSYSRTRKMILLR